jgi:DNA-binding transcriptional regulator YiaG
MEVTKYNSFAKIASENFEAIIPLRFDGAVDQNKMMFVNLTLLDGSKLERDMYPEGLTVNEQVGYIEDFLKLKNTVLVAKQGIDLNIVAPEWIRQRRKEKGLTLEELGRLTGTTKNMVSAWESDSEHSRNPRGPAKAALWYALQ